MEIDYKILPDDLHNDTAHRHSILEAHPELSPDFYYRIIRRNIDGRKNPIHFVIRAEVSEKKIAEQEKFIFQYPSVADKKSIHIIGAGPCGYFAALECIRLGYKPIVLERGKDVRARRRDLRNIQQFGIVDPHSNYCYGEGGAGTYSDGKLYTRSNKRGNIFDVLEILVAHGAHEDIMVDVHPHIGSNKLPMIISAIRDTIISHGGEVHFDTHVTDWITHEEKIISLITSKGEFSVTEVILATGHSARDIYYLLRDKKLQIEAKSFALGVRIEHPQSTIDHMQYKQKSRQENLPAAAYSISCQANDKGVFSFCMCPGGLIVPAATAAGEIVVNGMSLSRRDSPYANSGFVTSVDDEDFAPYKNHNALRALEYQRDVERKVFSASDGTQKAPAQRAMDFLQKKNSNDLPSTSYIPGIIAAPVHEILPSAITARLQHAMKYFSQKLRNYITNEAILVATESRTSAPVKIPRDSTHYHHPQLKNLYPAGEGAGYAGGILSAAMDGQNVIRNINFN